MKRIGVCNLIEEGRFGGPQARITAVAAALKNHRVDTYVAYSKYNAEKFSRKLREKEVSSSPLNIIRLSKERKVLIRYIFCFLPEVFTLYSFFKRKQFDIVHVNGSYQFKGALAAKLAGVPVVWHLNDTNMTPIIKKTCILLARYCASGFIVAGKKVHDLYIKDSILRAKPNIEIHAPVDTTVFDPKCVVPDKRLDKYDGIKIVTISNINPTKGLEYFIEMASGLAQGYDNLHFFIGGPVYASQKIYLQNLKALASSKGVDNLRFLGRLDNVASALKAADIFVFTSLEEASPTAVWEAMAMGKAIVSTDVGSVSQYSEDGKTGFIVPIKDSKALSEKVEILIKNPALRHKMGAEARAVAKEKLDVSIAAEKHAFFYRKILGR